MRRQYMLLAMLIIAAASAQAAQYSVCSTGCDFTNITGALENVTGTGNTLFINGSGTYNMTNTTTFFVYAASSNGGLSVNASDVILECNNVSIAGNSTGYGIFVTADNVTVHNCQVSNYTQGIRILGSSQDSVVSGSIISDSDYGLWVSASNYTLITGSTISSAASSAVQFANGAVNNTLLNCIIQSSVQDISSSGTGSSNLVVNSSFDGSKSTNVQDSSRVFVKWYFRVFVNDTSGNQVNATVNISDSFSTLAYSLQTDASGYTAEKNITEYMRNSSSSSIFYTNYTFYAYNSTNFENSSVNVTGSGTIVLTFDLTAPQISGIQNSTSNESVNITWTTDDLSNSSIRWGNSSASLNNALSNSSMTRVHFINISDEYSNKTHLDANTTYYFNITSCNDQGLCTEAGVFNFTTNTTIDRSAPSASNIVNTTTNESALITFDTDDNANATVEYGTNVSMTLSTGNSSYNQNHTFNITGLSDNTTYYYNITVCNGDQYCNEYGSYNFTTNATIDYSAPVISNILNTTTNESVLITFDTDDNANATIEYGTNVSMTLSTGNSSYNQNHTFNITGLDSNTTYYYNITACNSNGNCTEQGVYNFTTNQTTPDTSAPVISNIMNTTTNSTATITFDTDDSANATIKYGTSTSLGSSAKNSTLAHNHSFSITGLDSNTTYYLNITACNSYDNCTEQGTYSFTTNATIDTSAPAISNIINTTTNSTATITFDTDDSANATIKYGTSTSLGSSAKNSTLAHNHSFSITGLDSNTTYYYNITACNIYGYCSEDGTYSYQTNTTPDQSPPVISSVSNSSITNISAVISWTTNEAANSTVKYGTSSGSYTASKGSATMTTSHSVTLTGLSDETTYYYAVNSSDASGNSAQGSEKSFTTSDSTPPVISSVQSSGVMGTSATISWTTDETADSQVKYGTTSNSYSHSKSTTGYFTNHSIALSGLSGDTTYYYRVVSNDSTGNSAQSSQGSFTTTDTEAPSITFTYPVNASTTVADVKNVRLTVTTDEAATCTATSYKIGSSVTSTDKVLTPANANNVSHTAYFNATSESSGYNFYFTVQCIDSESNSRTSTVYFKLDDTTAPTATFVSPTPADGSVKDSENLTVKLSVSEGQASGYPKLSIDGGSNASMTSSSGYYTYTKKDLSEGSHNFTVYLSDAYGNKRSYTRDYTVDTEAPDFDEMYPEDDDVISNCMDLVLNITLDEEADCQYVLYEYREEKYDSCIDNCDEDKTSCNDDEDKTTTECNDDYDTCESDCDDDKYREKKSGDLKEEYGVEDCKNDCDDVEDSCVDDCKDEKATCIEGASDSSDRDDCTSNYEDCKDSCSDDKDDCYDDCNTGSFFYVEKFDTTCLADGDYMAEYTCEDNASNVGEENVTFTMSDTTAPEIVLTSPNGTIEKSSTKLSVTTDEYAVCRFSESNVGYGSMNYTFIGNTKTHTYTLGGLENKDYQFYVLCNDSNGNVMDNAEKIAFTVSSSTASSSVSHGFKTMKAGESQSFIISQTDIPVTKITVTVNEDVQAANINVKKLSDTSSIKKPSKPVYQYIEVTKDGISNKQIAKATIDFMVPKSWLDDNGLKPEDVSLFRYTTTWEEVPTTKISEDGNNAYYQAETTDFSVFAIMPDGVQATTTTTKQATQSSDSQAKTAASSPDNSSKEASVEQPADVAESGGSYTWLIILLCVVVVGGGSAVFYVYKSHRHPQQDSFAEAHKQPTHSAAAGERSTSQSALSAAASLSPEQVQEAESAVRPDDELGQYIVASLKSGQDIQAVKKALLDAGYDEDSIGAELAELKLADPLADYIKTALEAGQELDVIKNGLIDAGYGPQDVVNKFSDMGLAKMDSGRQDMEINDYIRASLGSGMRPGDIKQALQDAGHDPGHIDELMAAFESPQPAESGETVEQPPEESAQVSEQQSPEEQAQPEDADAEIKEYITKSFRAGEDASQIRTALVGAGHGPEKVDRLISGIVEGSGTQQPQEEQEKAEPAKTDAEQEKPQSAEDHTPKHDEVMDYIKDATEDRVPRRVIKTALVKAGHSKKEIDKRFREIDTAQKKMERDIRQYFRIGKKEGKTKKQIKEDLIDSGIDARTIRKIAKV